MANKQQDLKDQAIEAVANYMHHRFFDEGIRVNMLQFLREQAESLIDITDKAVEATVTRAKLEGVV
ncbi:MAG: hypothetical protein WC100_01715 [Sterolibacterium sp.]